MQKFLQTKTGWTNNKTFIVCSRVLQIIVCLYALTIWILLWAVKADKYMIFVVIPSCLIISIINKNDWCIWIGEVITIAADVFLIIYGKATIGVSIFVGVQIAYASFFWRLDKNLKRNIIVIAITVVLIALCVPLSKVVMKDKFDATVALVAVYLPILVCNIVHCALLKKIYLAIAFSLFLLCDICVGLPFLVPSDNPLIQFINKYNFCHVFYIPSQIMIAFASHTCDMMWNKKIANS